MKYDALFIVALMAIVAAFLYFMPDLPEPETEEKSPNSHNTLGESNVPNDEDDRYGPMYLVYNVPWLLDPSTARFLAMPVASPRLQ